MTWAAARRVAERIGGSDPALERALRVLGWSVDQTDVVALASCVAAGATLVSAALATVSGAAALAALVGGGAGAYGVRSLPVWLAETRRARAVGAAPELVALAVLRARVDPTPERAAAFATEHARDPLAASLREHAARARGQPHAGWEPFGATWREWAPGLGRAVDLLSAAFEAPEGQRERLLERSLAATLDGTREQVAAFGATLKGPTTALYAFGVVLPLALVAAVPAARSAGISVPLVVVVTVYDLLLPAGLAAAGVWLLGRQPTTFPSVAVPRDHPDVPDRTALAVAAGVAAGVVAWMLAVRVGPAWTRWLLAPSWAVGLTAAVWLRPVVRVRRRVVALETGLPDALAVAGQHLTRGAAPEAAVAAAGRELDGRAADRFAGAAAVGDRLGVGLEAAFLGPAGAFSEVPSPRARAAVALLALAGREGSHGGRLLVELSDHLEDLLAVERDARRELATTAATLRNTAWCFAPLIGGTTVAMASHLDALDGGAAVPTEALGIAVGVYVVLLAAVLGGLAAALMRGFERVHVGYRAAVVACAAAAVFVTAVRGAGLLL